MDEASPDRLFERRWALTVLDRAFAWLEETYRASGRAELLSALRGYVTTDACRPTYTEAAAKLQMWNLDSCTLERGFEGHNGFAGIRPDSFSPDGKRFVTYSWDKTARVWQVASGRQLLKLDHPAGLESANWSPDGTTIATAGLDGKARLWNAESGQLLAGREATYGQSIICLAFDPLGKRLAYAGGGRWVAEAWGDTSVRVWDLASDRQQSLPGHTKANACEFGSWVCAASAIISSAALSAGSNSARSPANWWYWACIKKY